MKSASELNDSAKQEGRKFLESRAGRRTRDILFVLFVFLCFPVGLYLLWTRKKDYPFWLRAALTVLVAAFVISAVAIAMPKDHYSPAGIEYVNASPDSGVYMPIVPEVSDSVVTYKNAYSAESVIVTPVATQEPVYVWCNDMGKYYHTESCRYVKETTPRVTLQQALIGGFAPCPDCKPPKQ